MEKNFIFPSKTTFGILLNFLLTKQLSNVSWFLNSNPMLMVLFNVIKHNLLLKVAFKFFKKKSLKLNLLWFILRANLHYFLHHNNWKYGSHVQFDMKITFIHSAIDKNNYMVQALKFENQRFLQHVYHLKKSIYGLHQASHIWNHKFHKFFTTNKLQETFANLHVYVYVTNPKLIITIFVEDDELICCVDFLCIKQILNPMNDVFETTIGSIEIYIKLHIHKNWLQRQLYLEQHL